MTQKSITLRAARLDDAEPLTVLTYRTIRAKYPGVIGRKAVENYIASGAVPKYYRDNNASCVVAIKDGAVIGAYAPKGNSVDLMMVDLAHHRTGVGSLLLADAERTLFKTYACLSLDSFRDNAQANAFYTKHGWILDHHFDDPVYGIPTIRFVK